MRASPPRFTWGRHHELDGSQAAEFIAKNLPDGGKVAQIEGQAGSSAAILRMKGFKEGLAKYPKLKLVASVPGNWDGTKAYNATQTLLQKNPNIKAIYANNDTMAVGAAKAVSDMGRAGKVIIVGTDGIPAALDAIQNGTMSATVSPLPYYQGFWSLEAAGPRAERRESARLGRRSGAADHEGQHRRLLRQGLEHEARPLRVIGRSRYIIRRGQPRFQAVHAGEIHAPAGRQRGREDQAWPLRVTDKFGASPMQVQPRHPLLLLEGVSKSWPGVKALGRCPARALRGRDTCADRRERRGKVNASQGSIWSARAGYRHAPHRGRSGATRQSQ